MPLLIFLLLVLLGAVLLWPRSGLIPRWLRLRRMSERIRVEDLLKHLYNCETRGVPGTLEGLAGLLDTTRGTTHRILERAQELELVSLTSQGYSLTDTGRAYALRVLRTHRLLERFLADRTGLAPDRWHVEAERREHLLSEAETERLAHQMGHPLFDPHGDPIPTRTGEMPAMTGYSLGQARPGSFVTIVHVEDEPLEVYQRLLDTGVALGQTLEIREITPERIVYAVDGEERSLARILSSNLTVATVEDPGGGESGAATLDTLVPGQAATVLGISPACRGPQRRRLLDLGVVPGTLVRAVMQSASGSPVAYDIRGALIGLRQEQAAWIRIRPESRSGAAA